MVSRTERPNKKRKLTSDEIAAAQGGDVVIEEETIIAVGRPGGGVGVGVGGGAGAGSDGEDIGDTDEDEEEEEEDGDYEIMEDRQRVTKVSDDEEAEDEVDSDEGPAAPPAPVLRAVKTKGPTRTALAGTVSFKTLSGSSSPADEVEDPAEIAADEEEDDEIPALIGAALAAAVAPGLSDIPEDAVRNAFTRSLSLLLPTLQVHPSPFPSIRMTSIFDHDFLLNLRNQITPGHPTCTVQYLPRETDLYKYSYAEVTLNPRIAPMDSPLFQLQATLYDPDFISKLGLLTGIDLAPSMPDLSAHIYRRGNYLLTHEDDVRKTTSGMGRRIAFILYLVPEDWTEADGGALELLPTDKSGNAASGDSGTFKVHPQFGTLALFEVTPTSWHQVAEVTVPASLAGGSSESIALVNGSSSASSAKTPSERYRHSISGWFHGPNTSRLAQRNFSRTFLPSPGTDGSASEPSFAFLESLVSPTYLDPDAIKAIARRFHRECSATLSDFLREDVFEELVEDMACEVRWEAEPTGPREVRRFHTLREAADARPKGMASKILHLFRTVEFQFLLSTLTDETLVAHRVQGRMFKRGCYTLLHDQGHDPEGLDVVLSLGAVDLDLIEHSANEDEPTRERKRLKGKGRRRQREWDPDWGGCTHYISAGDDADENEETRAGAEMATLVPEPNTLSIIQRDKATHRFVRFVRSSINDEIVGLGANGEANGSAAGGQAGGKSGRKERARVEVDALYLIAPVWDGEEEGEGEGGDDEEEDEEVESEDLGTGDEESEEEEEEEAVEEVKVQAKGGQKRARDEAEEDEDELVE